MRRLKFFPRVLHGALCYMSGIALLVLPAVSGVDSSRRLYTACVVTGVVVLAATLLAKGPVASFPLLPSRIFEAFCYAAAIIVMLLPILFKVEGHPRLDGALIVMGSGIFLTTLLSGFAGDGSGYVDPENEQSLPWDSGADQPEEEPATGNDTDQEDAS